MNASIIILGVSGLLVTLFCFGSNRLRATLGLASLYLYGLVVDIGIQLEPPKLIAICSFILLFAGIYKYNNNLRKFDLFFFWLVMVCVLGYFFVPSGVADTGWARSADGKPIIQFLSFILSIGFFFIAYNGLRSHSDMKYFFSAWLIIALISSSLCYLQSVYFFIYQNELWGVFRVTDSTATATFELLGHRIQRANAFGGEPKQQGMHLSYFLIASLSLRNKLVFSVSQKVLHGCIFFIAGATFLTFSTGTFLSLLIFFTYIVFSSPNITVRYIPYFGVLLLILSSSILLLNEDYKTTFSPQSFGLEKVLEFLEGLKSTKNDNESFYGSDKELPATRYLIQNPFVSITGVGVGACPFYYQHLVPSRWEGQFLTPNSGVLWSIYSFGFIGILILIFTFRSLRKVIQVDENYAKVVKELSAFAIIYLISLSFFYWSFFILGIVISPALKKTTS